MDVFDGHVNFDVNLNPINDEISRLKAKTAVIEDLLAKVPFHSNGEISKDLDLKDFRIVKLKKDTQNRSAVTYQQLKSFTADMEHEVSINNSKVINLLVPTADQYVVSKNILMIQVM